MKKCLIFENSYKKESSVYGDSIALFLEQHGVSAERCRQNQYSTIDVFSGNDFVITLGGDGTVLCAARSCAPLSIPIFPVNLGEFGFIAGVQKESWKKCLLDFLCGKMATVGRNMIQTDVYRGGNCIFSSNCLNDAVITSARCAMTISFDVICNGTSLGKHKSDGVIVSTATGSTAYSASAGGPIVDPELDAFVLTLLNSFSLSSRPLVFNPDCEMRLEILPWRNESVQVIVDGQKSVSITAGDTVVITKAIKKVMLAGCTVSAFYSALRSKFDWAGGPHA